MPHTASGTGPTRFRGHALLVAVNEARLAAIGQPEDGQLVAARDQAEAALDEYDARHGYQRRRVPGYVYQPGERIGHYGWRSPNEATVERHLRNLRHLRNFVELVEEVDGWMVGEDDPPFGWSRDGTLSIARLGVERGLLYVIADTADIYATTDAGRSWLAATKGVA